ncbi:acyl-CoA carboxylase subunit beta [Lentisalinibacter salinarum]|uniref:acyl-CoA carboxylase subunit beta n=1 Tax=Lentisalinibacter salinarum TaxID=2992239 RepID=UPI003867FA0A
MPVYHSRIDTAADGYADNRAGMLGLIEKLEGLNARSAAISEQRRPRFEERGQLTPRERLSAMLDPGMPFLAIGNIAGYLYDTSDEEKSLPGGNVIVGIGFIAGVRCVVSVSDSGIQAGSLTEPTAYRILRGQEIALAQKLPFVHSVESAGANLMQYKVSGFLDGGTFFANLARLSAAGIPVVNILNGSSTAGGAYMPGLSDYVIAVRGRAKAFLAGPPLLKAATGEIATDEELGGAEMHSTVSGLVEYVAEDDAHAALIAREVVARLAWNDRCPRPPARGGAEPLFDPDEIAGIVPLDYRRPYEVREVIARIVDGSDFLDFKPRYGAGTVCVQAEIHGQACGILANNAPIDPDGATKATQFLQLCDQSDLPVVFLQNTTGYMVGKHYEQGGMIKHGSKMIQAVTNISVPRLTLMIGASYGAGNYGMCGRGLDPDFLMTWPNASTGVMGGDQAATTMSIVTRAAAKAKGRELGPAEVETQERRLAEHFDSQSSAFYTSGHMLDDGMIDPRDSRRTLGFMLETVWEARNRTVKRNSFGIARM